MHVFSSSRRRRKFFDAEGEGRRTCTSAMDDQCLVLSGDWVCGDEGKWDFVIEKNQMGRMVEIHPGLGFKELEDNVLREFRLDEGHFRVSLSYWPPSSFELATGIRTPPVKGGMNLFARFDAKPKDVDTEVVDDSGMCFVSPTAARFQGSGEFGSGRSRKGYLSSAASKTKVINLEDDDDFVREVEKVEGIMFSDSCKAEEVSGCSLGTDEEENVERELDEIELRPRGYDKEFWDPLLAGDYGGSNAVNVVFNEDEIVEGLKKKNGPRSYFCDTNSCFDHWVEVGGGSVGDNKAKVENFGGVGSDDLGGQEQILQERGMSKSFPKGDWRIVSNSGVPRRTWRMNGRISGEE
ncbi:unnamed protein product [Brassica rapa]|uniref:Uncharacterized protein n=1 Tax=Brassica campestris TaxID=3711 RepID=A0A3P6B9Y7_BRACM|nr:unnamed protein product [Brassica rapa]VDC93281.1 unnamed protein product [Brassica rapa]